MQTTKPNPNLQVDQTLLKSVPAAALRQYQALPIGKQADQVMVACQQPLSVKASNELRFLFGCPVTTQIVSEEQMALLQQAVAKPIDSIAAQLSAVSAPIDALSQQQAKPNSPSTPLVEFVDEIIETAIRDGCSDIHFEPYADNYRIRYRQDGVLHNVVQPPPQRAAEIAARIKAMANMDIADKRCPQDGHIRVQKNNQTTDIRVSSLPTLHGEKIVLRILDSQKNSLGMDELGMTEQQLEQLKAAIRQPAGMILVTGPTGSGKTITLYSVLQQLNQTACNICTVEDPAEITVDGINQVSIQPKAGLDFPAALRAFLRQDPDIIMVGEIRDRETAEIAVKAAQTGHLLLSTLHTNDAPQALQRLNNIGIPNYQMAGCIQLIVAQRLLRKLCEHCKAPTQLSDHSYHELEIVGQPNLYKAVGCNRCRDGYKGRSGIFQVLPISAAIARLIASNATAQEIEQQARNDGIGSLRQAGLAKVLAGITSLTELDRVTNA